MDSTQISVSRLRAVRESQRRSLESVADEAGITPGHLSRIERGQKQPSVDVLVRIGRVLGLRDLVDSIGLFVEDLPP
jgi:transcriptional regulator with XRE-family HTH domain